jgi:hypothetical protein
MRLQLVLGRDALRHRIVGGKLVEAPGIEGAPLRNRVP